MRKFSGARGANLSSVGLAIAVALVVGLTGCAPRPAPHSPTPHSSVAPVFKTDAEALAAAKKAYEGYLAASDAIGKAGGGELQSLSKWATPKQFAVDKASFGRLQTKGEHLVGSSTYSKLVLQQVHQSTKGNVQVAAYVCVDVSGTRLLDRQNNDITPVGNDVVPLEIAFANARGASKQLLVDGIKPWSGTDFCS